MDFLGVILEGRIQAEIIRFGQRFQDCPCKAALIRTGLPSHDHDCALVYRQGLIRNHQVLVKFHLIAQAETLRAGSEGIVEGKAPWLHLVNADCTVRTGKALAEIHRLTAAHIHHHQSAAQGHDCLYGICKPFFNTFLYNQTVHHDFNVVLDVLLQPDFL